MITGGIIGLLVGVIYTLVTGKLQLTKSRIAYGTPARAAALLGLVPLMLLSAFAVRVGGIANLTNGLVLFLVAMGISIGVIYMVAWPFGQPPRS